MDEQFDFRALLLKLQDHLSDADRRRLHFLVGDIIPRQIRDDPSLNGTLNLLETLFDQARINEQDFDYLIHAFNQIQCYDAVKRLKEHQRSKQDELMKKTLVDDNVEDRITYKEFSQIAPPNILLNTRKPTQSRFPFKSVSISQSSRDIEPLSTKKDISKYFTYLKQLIKSRFTLCQFALLILNIIGIITLTLIIVFMKKQNHSSNVNLMVVKVGLIHGTANGGEAFNDAVDCSLTFDDRIIEVRGGGSPTEIEYVTFFYSNGKSRQHGRRTFQDTLTTYSYEFTLNPNEYIDGVTVYSGMRLIVNPFAPNGTFLVVGFQFRTNKDRKSELFGSSNGTQVNEYLQKYLLGYTRGQAYGYIDALQFTWYTNTSTTDTAVLPIY